MTNWLKNTAPCAEKSSDIKGVDGAQGRSRTADTAIFSRMLYQLSYLGVAGNGCKPCGAGGL